MDLEPLLAPPEALNHVGLEPFEPEDRDKCSNGCGRHNADPHCNCDAVLVPLHLK